RICTAIPLPMCL
uniref:Tigerinin-3O n=1 Tax=Hoplobatrachus occipitalis TaxID=127645 RepID=TIN3O_HOPOC|nr:RecName: Full=Tigerinin-3O [Hoplobatrachus occipitalis]